MFRITAPGRQLIHTSPFHRLLVKRIVVVVVLNTAFHSISIAQPSPLTFQHYNHEDGLNAPVTKIAKDSLGFLWLGTMDGLTRFDGKNFINFRNIPGDTHSLSNNIINDLTVDRENRIWAATNGGLCYFDFSNGSFSQIAFQNKLEDIDRYRVHAVTQSPDGNIWFASRSSIHILRSNTTAESYRLPDPEGLTIRCLYVDPEGQVWIGTNKGMYVFLIKTKTFIHDDVATPFSLEKGLTVTVHPILPFHGDTVLFGSWYGGLQKAVISKGHIISKFCPDTKATNPRKHVIKGVYPAGQEKWWIGSFGNGLSLYDDQRQTFSEHYHHDPGNPQSLGDDYIQDVYSDPSGILWIGTTAGLDKFDPYTQQFTSVPIPVSAGEFSVYRLPSSFTQDRDDPDWLWITVPGAGLYHYHMALKEFVVYRHDPSQPKSLPDNAVYTVFYDTHDRMHIGMKSGLCLFDKKLQEFIPDPVATAFMPKGVHTILQDNKGQYWFATHSNGIQKYDPSTGEWQSYHYEVSRPEGLPDDRVFSMIQDHLGDIWIGMQNRGLCRLNASTGQFTCFEHNANDFASLPDNGVYDLYEDRSGHLWVATENGLAVKSPDNDAFTTYTTQDGLSNNDVFSITPDLQGVLWLMTNNGLSKMDPVTHAFQNYFINDGLPSNSLPGSALVTPDGRLYFGTMGMITYCHPSSMKLNTHRPPVIITNFRIFDRDVPLLREKGHIMPIHLSYRNNMITFDFAALNFTNTSLNQYAYQLEGFNEQWISSGTHQSATFTNLDGGTYTFKVKGANNDGLWNESGERVEIIVHPPFWETWWFWLLGATALNYILYMMYRIRITQLLRVQKIRMRISRDLHDDVGSTLSSIHMISSMAKGSRPDPDRAKKIFETISTASSEAMELMSDIVWSINPLNDTLEMMLVRMRQYASETLEAAGIAFQIGMDDNSKQIELTVDIRKEMYLIFKEAINNLAKYSKASTASIHLCAHAQHITLTITDDGDGFEPHQKYAGNGLKNMQARAATLRGQLSIKTSPGSGATLVLDIPLTP